VEGKKYGAVVERGEVIFQDADAPPGPWWSLSKTALATAVLALVQRGELELDSPLAGREFTLRHLLRHSAGLPDYGDLADYHLAVSTGQSPWSYEELFTRVESNRLRSPPGTRFKYSNIGYTIVRMVIEKKTGLIDRGRSKNTGVRSLGNRRCIRGDSSRRPCRGWLGKHPWISSRMGIPRPCRQHAITGSAVSRQIVRWRIDTVEVSRMYAQSRHAAFAGSHSRPSLEQHGLWTWFDDRSEIASRTLLWPHRNGSGEHDGRLCI
jgi:hypothetical protein